MVVTEYLRANDEDSEFRGCSSTDTAGEAVKLTSIESRAKNESSDSDN